MLHILHFLERRFPGHGRAIGIALLSASALFLGIGVLLALQ